MVGAHRLTQTDVDIIKDLLEQGITHQKISDVFEVSRAHITKIANGHRWNDDTRSFIMKDRLDNQGIRSNDFRDFGEPQVELLNNEKDNLTMEQKYYIVKFIESLTGRKIKRMIVEM